MALLWLMQQEREDAVELENMRFRSNLIASHPDTAKDYLDILDGTPDEDEWARPLTDEEMMGVAPLTGEEINQALADLRRFGMSVS